MKRTATIEMVLDNLAVQTKALTENTIGKECESKIYGKIDKTNERIARVEDTLYSVEEGREGLVKALANKFTMLMIKIQETQNTVRAVEEKLSLSISEIKDRNLKNDSLKNYKQEIPNKWLTYLQIAAIIVPAIFYILSKR